MCSQAGGHRGLVERFVLRTRVVASPGLWLYQLSGDSLALELTAKGTKYCKDSDLN